MFTQVQFKAIVGITYRFGLSSHEDSGDPVLLAISPKTFLVTTGIASPNSPGREYTVAVVLFGIFIYVAAE